MKKRGFTLVELLAAIIILSLLAAIAVPSSIAISNRIKNKLLKEKYDFAQQAAILWATDHLECFNSSKTCTFLDYVSEDEKTMIVRIKMGELANSGFLKYDDKVKKTIENPVDKTDLSSKKVTIFYDIKTKTASSDLLDTNTKYTLAFNSGGGSGTMASINCTYEVACKMPANTYTRTGYAFAGWAEKLGGPVKYANSANIIISYNKTLYAIWTELDLTPPVIAYTPSKSYENGTNVFATSVSIKVSATDNSSGVKTVKYCTSTNASCTPATTITNNNSVSITGRTGLIVDNTICAIATDNAGNTSSSKCEIYKVDRENPKISCVDNATVWSKTTSTIDCTATDNVGVRKLEWSTDGTNWTTFGVINQNGPFQISNTSSFSTNKYLNKVRVTDAPGLTYTNNYIYSRVDTLPPLAVNFDIKYTVENTDNNIREIVCTNNEELADGTTNPSYNKYDNNICTVYTISKYANWLVYWYWPDDYISNYAHSGVSYLTYTGACSSSYYTGGDLPCMKCRSGNTIKIYTVDNAGNTSQYYLSLTIN